MGLKIVSLLFLATLGLTYGDENVNILYNTKVISTEHPEYAWLLNDGDTYLNLFYLNSNNFKWIVFDLGATYKLSSIVIANGEYAGVQPISFYIGDEYHGCKLQNQVKKYRACKVDLIQINPSNKFSCEGGLDTGRYLVVMKGKFGEVGNVEALNLFEVEAYGTKVDGPDIPTRPTFTNEDVEPITKDYFNITTTLLKGVETLFFPQYSSSIIYLNQNCQPIIWYSDKSSAFSVACQTSDGKGRLIVFGKDGYFGNILKDSEQTTFAENLRQWLAPDAEESEVVDTKSISSLHDLERQVFPGDIIDYNAWISYPDDVLDEIIRLCLSGTNSISIDHTFWVNVDPAARASTLKILRAFNMDYPRDIMNYYSGVSYSVNDAFTDAMGGIEDHLSRMAKNHDYFMAKGAFVAERIKAMSTVILLNSNIATYLLEIIKKYDQVISWICPCEVAQATDPDDRALILAYSQLIMSQSLVNSNYKLPCIDLFPGDFETTPPSTSTTITIKSQTSQTMYPTGLYLAAGATLKYKVTDNVGDWSISIGCHNDVLNDNRPAWSRYPIVYVGAIDLYQEGEIFSPFGGVIWLIAGRADQSITITLTNILMTPFFNARDSSAAEKWEKNRKNPGLWAQIASEIIVVCDKSVNVRALEGNYLMSLMKDTWDRMLKMDYAINDIDWKMQRPQIVVLDIMTEFGYGHSGYPIVVWQDWSQGIFNKSIIKADGNWGMCHEIGHNIQDSRWTYVGLDEVTNNLLCLYNYDKLWRDERYGKDISSMGSTVDSIKYYLDNGAVFDNYQNDPWVELAIYSQLANNLGWGFFKKVFKYYNDNQLYPRDDDEKISIWIRTSSEVSGQNLIPLFMFWGIPIDSNLKSDLDKLPCYFPNDFVTDFSPPQETLVLAAYPGCSRQSSFFEDYDAANDIGVDKLSNYITEL